MCCYQDITICLGSIEELRMSIEAEHMSKAKAKSFHRSLCIVLESLSVLPTDRVAWRYSMLMTFKNPKRKSE